MRSEPTLPGRLCGVRLVAAATLLAFSAVSAEAARRTSILRRMPEQGQMRPVGPFLCPDDLDVLLVDDDDNDPDVRSFYVDVLNALAVGANPIDFDVWDTGNSDATEPGVVPTDAGGQPLDPSSYDVIVWFSGDAAEPPFSGVAGPGAAGEPELASFVDGGGCLLLSSQDHVYDHGLTAFTMDRFGVAAVAEDVAHTSVSGRGPFAGLGSTTLDFPPGFVFTAFNDALTSDGTSTIAYVGDKGTAGLAKDTGFSRQAAFLSFPLEALPFEERKQALADFFAWCGFDHPFCSNRSGSGSTEKFEAVGFRAPEEGWVEISVTAASASGSIESGADRAANQGWGLDNFVVLKKSEFFESNCGGSGLPCSVRDGGSDGGNCFDNTPRGVQTAVFGGAVTPQAPVSETFEDADWQGGNPDPAKWILTGACFDPAYSAPDSVQPHSPAVPGQEAFFQQVDVCPSNSSSPEFNPTASGSIALFDPDIPGCQTTPSQATLTVHLDVGAGAGQLEPGEDYLVQVWWGPRRDGRSSIEDGSQLFFDILTSDDPFFEDGFESGDLSAWQ